MAEVNGTKPVASLNPNDVLLGRGSRYQDYIGNQRFLALVEERKEEYNKAAKNKTKSRLAKEFLDHFHSLGGLFLKLGDNRRLVDVEDSVWYETDEKTALDKIKQAFRQNRDYGRFQGKAKKDEDEGKRSGEDIINTSQEGSKEGCLEYLTTVGPSSGSALNASTCSAPLVGLSPNFSSHLPSITLGSGGSPVIDYSNLLAFQGAHSVLPPPFGIQARTEGNTDQISLLAQQNMMGVSGGMLPPDWYSRLLADSILRSQSLSRHANSAATASGRPEETGSVKAKPEASCDDVTPRTSSLSSPEASSPNPPLSQDEAVYVLSALGLTDVTKITDEQVELERSSLTNDEQAAALSDLFGNKCSVGTRKSKKVRSDFENDETIDFFVQQMKLELNMIPAAKKQALLEAQTKCRQEEFSDARFKHFLRADGMNPEVCVDDIEAWHYFSDLYVCCARHC